MRLVVVLALAWLVGCESVARVTPAPKPKPEVRTKAGNKSPYTVFGETYSVMPEVEAASFTQNGLGSWYGRKFHGRKTSNGEVFNMYAVSAAHKTLPIPIWVNVKNLDNGKSLNIRVNDRGPFVDKRIVDLSYAAAVKLGMAEAGVANVQVKVIGESNKSVAQDITSVSPPTVIESQTTISPLSQVERVTLQEAEPISHSAPIVQAEPPQMPVKNSASSVGRYLQIGVFSDEVEASKLADTLEESLQSPVVVKPADRPNTFRVAAGPLQNDADLERVKTLLQFKGYENTFTIYDFN